MRIVTRLAGITAAVLLLVGCASTAPDGEEVQASPSASAEAEVCQDTTAPDDLIIPGEPVTDEFGTYCTVVFDPAQISFPADAIPRDQIVELGLSLTDADFETAYNSYMNHLLDALFDNPRTDNFAQPRDEWIAENSYRYNEMSLADSMDGDSAMNSALMFENITPMPTPTVRDGGTRLISFNVSDVVFTVGWPVDASGGYDYSQEAIQVESNVSAVLYANDEQIVVAALENYPDMTEASLEESYPYFFDGVNEGLGYDGSVRMIYTTADLEVIFGTGMGLNVTTGSTELSDRG